MTPGVILTPQQARERLVEFYMTSFTRMYGHADRALVERKVVADLEYVANVKRDVTTQPRAAKRSQHREERPVEPAPVTTNPGFTPAGKGTPYRPKWLHRNPQFISEQWGAACARITRILEGAGGSSDLEKAAERATVPKLAAKFLNLYAFYMTRGRAAPIRGVDHNPFRELSDVDAARMFMRRTMDICDESTATLQHWWVK